MVAGDDGGQDILSDMPGRKRNVLLVVLPATLYACDGLPWARKFATALASRRSSSASTVCGEVVLFRFTLLTTSTRTSAARAPNADVRPG